MLRKLLLTKLTRASWFLHSARCPMLVNIYMKIHENILNIIYLNVKDRTWSCHKKLLLSIFEGALLKSTQARVMTPALCKSSYCAEYFHELSWKYLEQFQCYRADRILLQRLLYIRLQRAVTQNISPRVIVLALCSSYWA